MRKEVLKLETLPKGWMRLKGALTAPRGWYWASNRKSPFSGEREVALIRDPKYREPELPC